MTGLKWKDISSFAQGDKARVPCTFELRVDSTTLVVTRHIHHAPDAWILNFTPFFEGVEISRGTAEEAKSKALEVVRAKLNEVLVTLTAVQGCAEIPGQPRPIYAAGRLVHQSTD